MVSGLSGTRTIHHHQPAELVAARSFWSQDDKYHSALGLSGFVEVENQCFAVSKNFLPASEVGDVGAQVPTLKAGASVLW